MKRIIAIILCLTMVMSITSMTAFAADEVTGVTNEVVIETDIEIPALANRPETPHIDLTEETKTLPFEISYEDLDFSKAINVTDKIISDKNRIVEAEDLALESSTAPLEAVENQPPVAAPEIFILNSDSIRDGKYTTASIFFIATRWNNVDLCYDPEGGPITLVHNTTFPAGYVTPMEDEQYGTYAGYAIQILDPGVYPFVFTFVDMYGGSSEVGSLVFEVISRGIFETIDGSISALTDTQTYEITVDYSATNEYYLAFLRTGTGGFSVTVLNPDGSEYDTCYCSGPNSNQDIKTGVTLTKPAGATGLYTYTVKVSASEYSYVEGDVSYRIAYGAASQKNYFFEGVANSTLLPYYNSVRNFDQNEAEYVSRSPLSEIGDYYLISATGTEAVTLASTNGQYRFRILDAETLNILYDGAELTTYKPDEYSSYYIRADLTFAAGASYYVVVYLPAGEMCSGAYSIMVGDPKLYYDGAEYNIPAQTFVKGTPYVWVFNLQMPNLKAGYVDFVAYSGTQAAWPFEGGHFSVLTPGTSTWRTNSLYYSQIDFNFDDLNTPLVNAVGQWQFRITAGQSGNYPGQELYVHFWYEI